MVHFKKKPKKNRRLLTKGIFVRSIFNDSKEYTNVSCFKTLLLYKHNRNQFSRLFSYMLKPFYYVSSRLIFKSDDTPQSRFE